jgi:hypothetical protein
MKIRIKNNSLRLRLTKTDIDIFGSEGYIEEKTEIGSEVFIYGLQRGNVPSLTASLENNKITMYMSDALANEWINSERVGYENNILLPSGSNLHLLLEKDFKCLNETSDNQSDNYENPLVLKPNE